MAINSCSINAFTINSLACRRRSFVVNTVNKPHQQHVAYRNWGAEHEEDAVINQLEASHMNVAITLHGKTYEQSLENSMNDVIPMIVMSAINIETVSHQEVEISNLKISTEKK